MTTSRCGSRLRSVEALQRLLVVTIARASDAVSVGAAVSKKRDDPPRSPAARRGGRHDAADGRANERGEELLGVGDDDRDDVAALEAGALQSGRHAVSGRADVLVRTRQQAALADKGVAGALPWMRRRALRRASSISASCVGALFDEGGDLGHHLADSADGRHVVEGIEMSKVSSSSATTSSTCSESKPRSATNSLDNEGSIGRRLTFMKSR